MPQRTKKISSFQGLRGVAQMLIIISHCNVVTHINCENIFKYFGCLGVTLFIVLSGFLEMKSLETSNEPYLYRFKRKISKFYWLHILTLMMAIPLTIKGLLSGEVTKWLLKFICNIALLQSWFPSSGVYFSFNAVSWCLSTMVVFIAIAPLVFEMIKQFKLTMHILIN